MRNRTPLLALLAVAGLLLYSAGCDSVSNPVAPTGSVLTVTANPTFVGLTGSSTITVSGFKPDGNPLNPGTQINLSASQGTIPSLVEVDSTGRATATFTADERAGTATITASLPGNDAIATATVEIGEQRPVLEITASPTTVPLRGTATITVVARDFNGFALGRDGPIVLTASNGTVDSNIRTNRNGVAEATFTAGDEAAGSGMVSAFLRNSETVSVEIVIRDVPTKIVLTANPLIITRVPEGVSLALDALVINDQGSPVGNIIVTFKSSPGVFAAVQVATSSSQGRAIANLTITQADLEPIALDGSFEVTADFTTDGITTRNDTEVFVTVNDP